MVVMMAGNEKVKRKYISKKAVEWRRKRVMELRLAGFSAVAVAAQLRGERGLEHTTERQVWSDIQALEERAKLEEIEPETIVRDIFRRCRDSNTVVRQAGHRRFEEINDQIARVQEQIGDVNEKLQDPGESIHKRGELVLERDRLVTLAGKLRREAREETRVIISINKTLIAMPKKLGLEREDVGFHDDMKEAMIEAIENEPDPERQKRLIEAAELFAGII